MTTPTEEARDAIRARIESSLDSLPPKARETTEIDVTAPLWALRALIEPPAPHVSEMFPGTLDALAALTIRDGQPFDPPCTSCGEGHATDRCPIEPPAVPDIDACCDVRGGPERCGDCPKDRRQVSHPEPEEVATAPDRSALRGTLMNVLCNASNYPPGVGLLILGRDMSPLIDKTAAVLVDAGYRKLEETDEAAERMRVALNAADIDYSAREQRADAGGGDMEPGDWFTFIARSAIRSLMSPAEAERDAHALLTLTSAPHDCEQCDTCGVHGGTPLKCCGCYDGVCCQEGKTDAP